MATSFAECCAARVARRRDQRTIQVASLPRQKLVSLAQQATGAPGMNRTCDLRFRKPNNCVHLDLTGSEKPYLVGSFVQLVATSPEPLRAVRAMSVQQSSR